jgi:predicted enzyme related to lactoylglutathione lyase
MLVSGEGVGMIKKIAFVAQPTRDVARARAFYGELLGLAPGPDYGDTWVEFQAPDGKTIALDTYSPKLLEGATTYLAVETDDIEAELARLREAGAQIDKEVWTNEHEGREICKMAIVRDPDGHAIMLHQIAAWRE